MTKWNNICNDINAVLNKNIGVKGIGLIRETMDHISELVKDHADLRNAVVFFAELLEQMPGEEFKKLGLSVLAFAFEVNQANTTQTEELCGFVKHDYEYFETADDRDYGGVKQLLSVYKLNTIGDGDCGLRAFLQSLIVTGFIENKRDKVYPILATLFADQHKDYTKHNAYTNNFDENYSLFQIFVDEYLALEPNDFNAFELFAAKYFPPTEKNGPLGRSKHEKLITSICGCLLRHIQQNANRLAGDFVVGHQDEQGQFDPRGNINMQYLFMCKDLFINNGIDLNIITNPDNNEGLLSHQHYDGDELINMPDAHKIKVYILQNGLRNGGHYDAILPADVANKLKVMRAKDARANPSPNAQVSPLSHNTASQVNEYEELDHSLVMQQQELLEHWNKLKEAKNKELSLEKEELSLEQEVQRTLDYWNRIRDENKQLLYSSKKQVSDLIHNMPSRVNSDNKPQIPKRPVRSPSEAILPQFKNTSARPPLPPRPGRPAATPAAQNSSPQEQAPTGGALYKDVKSGLRKTNRDLS